MKPISPCPKPSYASLSTLTMAAALSCGLLLTACGGGGGGSSPAPAPVPVPAPPPPVSPPPPPAAGVSQADATADAANATASGSASTAATDEVFDSTVALTALVATASPGAAPRTRAQHATPQVVIVKNVAISCPGGGTATLSISGGTLASEGNDVLDPGEDYTITYTNCARATGLPQLNGSAELDVVSVSADASPVTAVTITMTNLALTLPQGTITANGSANLSRSSVTADGSTTTTSAISAGSYTLATAFNARTGSYTISNLTATRTATSTATGPVGSSFSGTHTLAGTANARTFSFTSSTNGATTYDASGAPTAGDWTVVRTDATIHAVVASGTVTLTVDDGSDGTIDNTWSFPIATLTAAAG